VIRALKEITFDQLLFLIIALIGVILFSFKITISPITYDEFSVINRSNLGSLSEVYSNTKSTDVHPPLMLFFLFFWLKIAGSNILLIKLPFLFAGIGSIFLIYKLVKSWFNSSTAILTTAFFVSVQFTILYSQLARPYILGLFFCLLFANYWTKIIENRGTFLSYLAYIITGTFCIYNHHYSLLQVGIIGISGLFIIKREQLKKYLTINIILALLFLPDLYLISQQLNYDGMSYIPKANLSHIINYLFYIFQFSYIPLLVVAGIAIFAIIKKKKVIIHKYSLLSISWFLAPIIIGCIVSALTKPAMPIRALIFSFPFIIIFIFSFIPKLNRGITVFFTLLILSSNFYALIVKRNHYEIFQKDIAKNSVENIKHLIENNKVKNPFIFYNYPASNIQFYWNGILDDYSFESLNEKQDMDSYKPTEYRKKIASINNDAIILCNIPNDLISITKEYFPYLIRREKGFNYDFYCFSKNDSISLEEFYFNSTIDFENEKINSENGYNRVVKDTSSANHYYLFESGDEWGPVLEIPLGNIIKDKYCIIETQVSVFSTNINHDGHLVFEVIDKDEHIIWYSSQLNNFVLKTNQWQNIYFSDQLNKLGGSEKITDSSTLKVYFWNKDKTPIAIDNLSVKIKEGNNEVYSLIYDYK
jgi:hypothetical protein